MGTNVCLPAGSVISPACMCASGSNDHSCWLYTYTYHVYVYTDQFDPDRIHRAIVSAKSRSICYHTSGNTVWHLSIFTSWMGIASSLLHIHHIHIHSIYIHPQEAHLSFKVLVYKERHSSVIDINRLKCETLLVTARYKETALSHISFGWMVWQKFGTNCFRLYSLDQRWFSAIPPSRNEWMNIL